MRVRREATRAPTGLRYACCTSRARPNLPKLAPVYRAAQQRGLEQTVVHTGQHYDDVLSATFFRDLELPPPDINLEVGSHSHAVQTALVLERLEPAVTAARPDWVVLYGDVNSTLAGALVAAKLGVPSAHVEAGLRSGDRRMPEEINRIVADRLASLLLTPSRDADATLRAEGEPESEIVFVGNVMIDSVLHGLPRARQLEPQWSTDARPVVVTLHSSFVQCRRPGAPRRAGERVERRGGGALGRLSGSPADA